MRVAADPGHGLASPGDESPSPCRRRQAAQEEIPAGNFLPEDAIVLQSAQRRKILGGPLMATGGIAMPRVGLGPRASASSGYRALATVHGRRLSPGPYADDVSRRA